MASLAALFGLDFYKNYSYFTIPAAFVALALPHTYVVAKAGKQYDNANPRTTQDKIVKNDSIDKITKNRMLRAKAASENGFETIGLFAAAVVAGNQANLDNYTLNFLTIGYVLTRLAYNYSYIWLCENRNLSGVRSAFWSMGITFIFVLYWKAGNVFLNQ